MNTLLLIPTEESAGLTSACLGMIYALDCSGIKAGFVKPFVRNKTKTITVPQRSMPSFSKLKPLHRLLISKFKCNEFW